MTIKQIHILSLGAGVQSTTLYLKFLRGEILPQIDYAICADTQEEPEGVYAHLAWLQSLNGPEILVRTMGKLGDDLIHGNASNRFASIPAFTSSGKEGERAGRTRRQCSRDYKTDVIDRTTRREILGLKPGQRTPSGVEIHRYIGISLDEQGRASRIAARAAKQKSRTKLHFPLIEQLWTRADCLNYLADKVPHQTPRSACVFCPYHSDAEWHRIKHEDAAGWKRAVEIDRALRAEGSRVNKDMTQTMYLHRSCQPLELVQLDTRPTARESQLSMSFTGECEGVCGN